MLRTQVQFILIVVLILSGCGANARRTAEVAVAPAPEPVLLHLPGIAGARSIDRDLVEGLDAGGMGADFRIFDWTGNAPALKALVSRAENEAQAQRVADFLTEKYREDPRRTINVISHSGGCGIAVWALEKLPDDVKIDSLTMIAPALSPGYDLSDALGHVRGKAYCFYSRFDPVLELGTRLFGTIDGVKSVAAGRVGFTVNDDSPHYSKLQQIPYDPVWRQFYNFGDHVGAMSFAFARRVIAPLILTGRLPLISSATQPTTAPAGVIGTSQTPSF